MSDDLRGRTCLGRTRHHSRANPPPADGRLSARALSGRIFSGAGTRRPPKACGRDAPLAPILSRYPPAWCGMGAVVGDRERPTCRCVPSVAASTSGCERRWSPQIDVTEPNPEVNCGPSGYRQGVGRRADRPKTRAGCGATSPAVSTFWARCGANTAPVAVLAGHTILRIRGQGCAAVVHFARQEPR
jgi:hypothetical protein